MVKKRFDVAGIRGVRFSPAFAITGKTHYAQ